jgi:hypothetical protein
MPLSGKIHMPDHQLTVSVDHKLDAEHTDAEQSAIRAEDSVRAHGRPRLLRVADAVSYPSWRRSLDAPAPSAG